MSTVDTPSRALWMGMGLVTGTVLASSVWHLSKTTIEQYVPIQYQYRPGTISGWLAKLLNNYSKHRRNQRPVRVYLDGCFDMMHYGHANALRQAKASGDQLVVGLIPDSEILRCKGPPVLNEEERLVLVDCVKWVDEVITGVPYDLSPEFIQELFTKHKIDYIIHGDDPCLLPDGSDAYAHAKKLGRFRMIKRTEGVSTTDIVGRMLTCTRVNPFVNSSEEPHPLAAFFSTGADAQAESDYDEEAEAAKKAAARTTLSKFLPTSRRLVQFSNGRTAPEDARIVYIDGAFDVFHPGHVKILKEAKAQGDFLLVGLHTDEDVQDRRGPHLPIMNLHERSLSVLACKYVDEVIIGSPTVLTQDLINTFNISLVVRGTVSETGHHGTDADEHATTISPTVSTSAATPAAAAAPAGSATEQDDKAGGQQPALPAQQQTQQQEQQQGGSQNSSSKQPALHNGVQKSGGGNGGVQKSSGSASSNCSNGGANGNGHHGHHYQHHSEKERYTAAIDAGIFRRLPSPSQHTARNIIQRIVAKRQEFEARNAKKVKSEVAYYTDKKTYVAEL